MPSTQDISAINISLVEVLHQFGGVIVTSTKRLATEQLLSITHHVIIYHESVCSSTIVAILSLNHLLQFPRHICSVFLC